MKGRLSKKNDKTSFFHRNKRYSTIQNDIEFDKSSCFIKLGIQQSNLFTKSNSLPDLPKIPSKKPSSSQTLPQKEQVRLKSHRKNTLDPNFKFTPKNATYRKNIKISPTKKMLKTQEFTPKNSLFSKTVLNIIDEINEPYLNFLKWKYSN